MQDCETIRLIAALRQGSFRAVRFLVAMALSLLVHALVLCLPVHPGGGAAARGVLTVHLSANSRSAAPPPSLNGAPDSHLRPSEQQAAADTPALGLPHYYRCDELDERPAILTAIDTDIPLSPGDAFSATARFRLYLDETGGVDKVEVERSDLPQEALDVLRERFLAARASPGRLGGTAVRSQIAIRLKVEGE